MKTKNNTKMLMAVFAVFATLMAIISVAILMESLEIINEHKQSKSVGTTQAIEANTPYNDDFDFYTYKITEVFGDEINGIGLDNNGGIVLSKTYDKVDLAEGDVITVVFEAGVEDAILDVIKQ